MVPLSSRDGPNCAGAVSFERHQWPTASVATHASSTTEDKGLGEIGLGDIGLGDIGLGEIGLGDIGFDSSGLWEHDGERRDTLRDSSAFLHSSSFPPENIEKTGKVWP
mmetsp:Transcript_25990/g.68194  ORF Transcript_25990/g.68194 Transcript_25990/m.68194 type:complete len:108 (-) Transcript_25990:842-1165(-)